MMEDLSKKIKFYFKGYDSSKCLGFLFDLYSPIIGKTAILFYINILNYCGNDNELTIGDVLKKADINSQEFLLSRRTLESIGLINTFKNPFEDLVILINEPLYPSEFFKSIVLNGLFVSTVGKEKAQEIVNKYSLNYDLKNYKEISASINDSFSVSFEYGSVIKGEEKLVTKNNSEIKIKFNKKMFFDYIKKNSQISESAISSEELKKIIEYTGLYGFGEKVMAEITIDSFDFKQEFGHKINFEYFANRAKHEISLYKPFKKADNKAQKIDSDTELANKINMYESTSPRIFLKKLQGNVEPVRSDLNLLEDLSQNLGLSNGIINVLIDYCNEKNNGQLNGAYVKKIGASLIRAKVSCALDCINYLYKSNKTLTSTNNNEVLKKGVIDATIYDGNDDGEDPFGN
jgi:replication initiation and membrane attachment protein DnaB